MVIDRKLQDDHKKILKSMGLWVFSAKHISVRSGVPFWRTCRVLRDLAQAGAVEVIRRGRQVLWRRAMEQHHV